VSSPEIRARARASQQVDRLHDDGLARAGFAGNEVEARFELHLEAIDHRQAADAQEAKHVEAGTLMISDL
jgi:hypothetical protein